MAEKFGKFSNKQKKHIQIVTGFKASKEGGEKNNPTNKYCSVFFAKQLLAGGGQSVCRRISPACCMKAVSLCLNRGVKRPWLIYHP